MYTISYNTSTSTLTCYYFLYFYTLLCLYECSVEDYLTSDVIGVKVKDPIELAKRLQSRNAITAEELEAVSTVLSYILYNWISKEPDAEKIIKQSLSKEKDLLIRGKSE